MRLLSKANAGSSLGASFQYFHCRQHLAFDELEESTTAGGNVGDILGNTVLVDGRQGVATTGNGECRTVSDSLGQDLGAVAELVEFEHADRTVPEDGLRRLQQFSEVRGGLRADIQDHVVSSNVGNQFHGRHGALGELLGHHHVHWQRNADLGGDGAGGIEQVRLVEGLAHRMTGRSEEGVGDAATDDQLVADLAQAVEHVELGRDLGAGNDGGHRLGRCTQSLAQGIQFSGQQRASGSDLGELGHAVGRTLGTVGGTKGVHHEHVAQGSVLLGQLVGVLFLAFVEAYVFEQYDVSGLDLDTVQVVGHQRHVTAQGLAQVVSNRLEAVLGRELAFGRTAQVRADHDRRAFFQGQLDGRQRSQDTRIAGDNTVLDGDVEVFADQYALTLQIEVGHLQHGHGSQSLVYGFWWTTCR